LSTSRSSRVLVFCAHRADAAAERGRRPHHCGCTVGESRASQQRLHNGRQRRRRHQLVAGARLCVCGSCNLANRTRLLGHGGAAASSQDHRWHDESRPALLGARAPEQRHGACEHDARLHEGRRVHGAHERARRLRRLVLRCCGGGARGDPRRRGAACANLEPRKPRDSRPSMAALLLMHSGLVSGQGSTSASCSSSSCWRSCCSTRAISWCSRKPSATPITSTCEPVARAAVLEPWYRRV
jgi:hypothetical protein